TAQARISPLASSGRSGTISSASASGSASSTFCTGGGGNSARVCTSGSSGASPTATPPVPTVRSRALSPKPAISVGGSSTPASVTWTYTYNNFQEVTTATDPAGHATTNNYDANGNLLSTTTPSPDGSSP